MQKQQLHIVLGGSGAIGNSVLMELKSRNINCKTVERSKEVFGFETTKADLLDLKQIVEATTDATHVYLCVGLQYSSNIWTRDWPKVMENTIKACQKNNAKLIFFDNIYMYGPVPLKNPFNEEHSQYPSTKKGKARKVVTDMMLQAIKENKIQGVIGRSADFYGPNAVNSSIYAVFLENILQGKNPQFLSKTNVKHTFAYTEDNGKALVILALDESTYGQTWHLPVSDPVTLDYILEFFNKKLNKNFKAVYISKFMQNILGLFIKPIKEVGEMLYQFDNEYIMSSQKFMTKFPGFKITSYDVGLTEMIKSFQK